MTKVHSMYLLETYGKKMDPLISYAELPYTVKNAISIHMSVGR